MLREFLPEPLMKNQGKNTSPNASKPILHAGYVKSVPNLNASAAMTPMVVAIVDQTSHNVSGTAVRNISPTS